MFNIIFCAILCGQTLSKLVVQGPSSLKALFRDGVIQASYANFGFIPYGHTMFGGLYFQEKFDTMCGEHEQYDTIPWNVNGYATFVLADRGGCSFVEKVRNMEMQGAALGIVIDNTDESIEDIVMSDDGTGAGIRVPSMLISKKDGLKLIDFMNTASEDELKQVTFVAEFDISRPDNRVEYDIWFSSTDDKMFDFMVDFARVD